MKRLVSYIIIPIFIFGTSLSNTLFVYAQAYNPLDPWAAGVTHGNLRDPLPTDPAKNPKISAPKLSDHLLINEKGVGDNCRAGNTPVVSWKLDSNVSIDTKEKLKQVVLFALENDTRIRQITIYDDQLDIYYLQPAYYWGFVPTNYLLHIRANADTFRMSLNKPTWLKRTDNYHVRSTEAFTTYIPQLLTTEVLDLFEDKGIPDRDAKLLEVITTTMQHVNVSPISNSFFTCYILPFLLYIVLVIVLGVVIGWYFIRKLKKETGFRIHKVNMGKDEDDEDDTSLPQTKFTPKKEG